MRFSFTYFKCSYDSQHTDPTEWFASHDVKIHIYYIGPRECTGTQRMAVRRAPARRASLRREGIETSPPLAVVDPQLARRTIQRHARKDIRSPDNLPDRRAELHDMKVKRRRPERAAAQERPIMWRYVEEGTPFQLTGVFAAL